MRWILLAVGASLVMASGKNQAQEISLWQKMSEQYPQEPAVYLVLSETLNIQVKGDSLDIRSDVLDDMLFLKEQTDLLASRKIHGNSFVDVRDLKAQTLVWDKNRYREFPVTTFRKTS